MQNVAKTQARSPAQIAAQLKQDRKYRGFFPKDDLGAKAEAAFEEWLASLTPQERRRLNSARSR